MEPHRQPARIPAALEKELARLHKENFHWALTGSWNDTRAAAELLAQVYAALLQSGAALPGQSSLRTQLLGLVYQVAPAHRRRLLWRFMNWDIFDNLSQASQRLREMLMYMPLRQLKALQLFYSHQLSVDETAAVMRLSPQRVERLLDRGRQDLQEMMGAEVSELELRRLFQNLRQEEEQMAPDFGAVWQAALARLQPAPQPVWLFRLLVAGLVLGSLVLAWLALAPALARTTRDRKPAAAPPTHLPASPGVLPEKQQ